MATLSNSDKKLVQDIDDKMFDFVLNDQEFTPLLESIKKLFELLLEDNDWTADELYQLLYKQVYCSVRDAAIKTEVDQMMANYDKQIRVAEFNFYDRLYVVSGLIEHLNTIFSDHDFDSTEFSPEVFDLFLKSNIWSDYINGKVVRYDEHTFKKGFQEFIAKSLSRRFRL